MNIVDGLILEEAPPFFWGSANTSLRCAEIRHKLAYLLQETSVEKFVGMMGVEVLPGVGQIFTKKTI